MTRFIHILPACLLALLALSGSAHAASYFVTSQSDVAIGSAANCTGSAPNFLCDTLRDAIAAANASPEDDGIGFHPLFVHTITLAHGPLVIADAGLLLIDGERGNGGNLRISGNSEVRVFQIQANARATLRKLSIVNGQVGIGEGGAGIANAGVLTLEYGDVSGNSGFGVGGIVNSGTLDLRFSTVSGNGGYHVGGISNTGTLSLFNSTVSGNSAYGIGGIANEGTLHLAFGTVANNQSGIGVGGLQSANGEVTLITSVLAGNSGSDCARTGGSIDASHSLIASGLACVDGTSTANLQGDAKLDVLASNGGSTLTHHPRMDSPLIDAVPCHLVSGLTQDQRGTARPQGRACDIGAVEAHQIVVDTVADNTVWDGFCSLREAFINAREDAQTYIDCPAGTAWDIIVFDPAVFSDAAHATIVVGSLLPSVPGHALVDGRRGDGGNVRISGNDAVPILAHFTEDETVLRRLTFVNGFGGLTPQGLYGGALTNFGQLTLEHCVVSDSSAVHGGGIYNFGDLTLRHSTLTGNDSARGGGIYHPNAGKRLTVEYSTISGNHAGLSGGGIHGVGTTVVRHSTVSQNTCGENGGGIYYQGSEPLSLEHATVTGNSAASGGGLWSDAGNVSLAASVIANSPGGGDCVRANGLIHASGSLIGTGLGCVNGTSTGNLSGDPRLLPLADNGGDTRTHLPQSNSRLIDAVSCPAAATDQRGIARPQGALCDIGAVEVRHYPLSVVVTGGGRVSGSPRPTVGAIEDCRPSSGSCSADYPESFASPVVLSATPDAGWYFVAWGGDCSGTVPQASVTMASARTCTATFAPLSACVFSDGFEAGGDPVSCGVSRLPMSNVSNLDR